MRIGFVVNDVQTEEAAYTTVRLGMTATKRGHESWFMGVGDLAYDPEGSASARARRPPDGTYSRATLPAGGAGQPTATERIKLDDLDVILLRNDPSTEKGHRNWAQTAGIDFGRLAMINGVVVLNDPTGRDPQQDVPPALPRGGPPADAHHPRPRRDQGLREGRGRTAR
ncbi:MAG: hypothetical protein U5R31_03255 [Acidimicrobiia bacterium]|nr:hypothetical protein [Acidimicrobiia bacterium]